MIASVFLKNFRGHKETLLEFKPGLNFLTGPNEAGKTTVGHALAFAFYGADMSGTTRGTDHLITFESDKTEVILKTDKAAFHRVKKRGDTSKIRVGLTGMPLMDADQTSLTQRLGIGVDVFCSAVYAGYFMRCSNEKRMEIIGQVVKLDRAELLRELIGDTSIQIPKSVKLVNPRLDANNLATERRRKQNELSADMGALSQLELQLKEMVQDAGDMNLDQLNTEIQKLSAQQELFQIYNQELQTYRVQLARCKDADEQNKVSAAERKKLELAIQALGTCPSSEEIALIEQEVHELQQRMDGFLAANVRPEPAPPQLKESLNEATCTRCGQIVSEKLKASIEQEREKLLTAYNKSAREVATHNQEVNERWEAMTKLFDQKTDLLKSKKAKAEIWSQNHSMFQARLKDLRVVEVKTPEPPIKPEGDEAKLRSTLQEMTAKKMNIQQMKARYDVSTSRRSVLETSVQSKANEVESLKHVEQALLKLPEAEVARTLGLLSMTGVRVSLSDNELFVTDENTIPYECLSTGRKMRVDIEVCKTFQRLLGNKAPGFYFIDDYDLLDGQARRHLPESSQIFIAKVSSEAPGLKIF